MPFIAQCLVEWHRLDFYGGNYGLWHETPPTSAYLWRMDMIEQARMTIEARQVKKYEDQAKSAQNSTTTTTTYR